MWPSFNQSDYLNLWMGCIIQNNAPYLPLQDALYCADDPTVVSEVPTIVKLLTQSTKNKYVYNDTIR